MIVSLRFLFFTVLLAVLIQGCATKPDVIKGAYLINISTLARGGADKANLRIKCVSSNTNTFVSVKESIVLEMVKSNLTLMGFAMVTNALEMTHCLFVNTRGKADQISYELPQYSTIKSGSTQTTVVQGGNGAYAKTEVIPGETHQIYSGSLTKHRNATLSMVEITLYSTEKENDKFIQIFTGFGQVARLGIIQSEIDWLQFLIGRVLHGLNGTNVSEKRYVFDLSDAYGATRSPQK